MFTKDLFQQLLLKFIVTLTFINLGWSQPAPSLDAYNDAYQKRIVKEYLDGVYIPKDLTEVFIEFHKKIDKEIIDRFKEFPEASAARQFHFSFGRWIIHNWSFYEGSRLSHYLKQLGVTHPDDMAQFVIVMFHRSLNEKPYNIKEQVALYQEKRKELVQKRNSDKAAILKNNQAVLEKKKEERKANENGG